MKPRSPRGLGRKVIAAANPRLDGFLEHEGRNADDVEKARFAGLQVLNDQAYYLLRRGQLEAEIDSKCRDAIRRRRNSETWQVRRGWDLYDPEDPRLSGLAFGDRAGLVLDRSAGRQSPFAKAMTFYDLRNRIAHGRLETSRVDVIATVRDVSLIQAALHRSE